MKEIKRKEKTLSKKKEERRDRRLKREGIEG